MDRVRDRIGDKRVLALVKSFLKAGVLTENGGEQDTISGTPQGGILSPLLSNIALSVLDDHVVNNGGATMSSWQRESRRRKGLPNYRIVRYADDYVVLVAGTKADAEQLRDDTAAVLAPMGLRLSEHKTHVVHIDEGFEFLGWRIQRHQQRGSQQRYVYTYPSRSALASIKAKVRTITKGATNQSLSVLLHRINRMLRGWANYFRHGASAKTFAYLDAFTWRRVIIWIRRKHRRISWKDMRKRHLNVWRPTHDGVKLFDPGTISIVRYRYRGNNIPLPWAKRRESAA